MTIVIVGAGVFGLSTAYHLLRGGKTEIVVLDKSSSFPVPDGASTDINRLIRTSYGDPLYTKLIFEAIDIWKTDYPEVYHESGIMILGDSQYAKAAQVNDKAVGARVTPLPDESTITAQFDPSISIGSFRHSSGYLNLSSGWANAAEGIRQLGHKVKALGGKIIGDMHVQGLTTKDGKVVGVKLANGEDYLADTVVIATGSWTPSVFPAEVGDRLMATGQSVATVKLSEEEYARYQGVPCVLDLVSGFYAFPPNEDRILKFSIHDGGVLSSLPGGEPRTLITHQRDGLRIPKQMVTKLKDKLGALYPELVDRPFFSTRLCWYCDTVDSDWLIDFHPSYPNVLYATGGSGHAYKFMPVLGKLVIERLEGTLAPDVAAKFAFSRTFREKDAPDRLARQTFMLREEDLAKDDEM